MVAVLSRVWSGGQGVNARWFDINDDTQGLGPEDPDLVNGSAVSVKNSCSTYWQGLVGPAWPRASVYMSLHM